MGEQTSMACSDNALPAGTVLREWRLEHVLGAGELGIVYKGRDVYFDDLVAIVEYFPSPISERDEEGMVVQAAAAKEAHTRGLRTFVEEAKRQWGRSTPDRAPDLVRVRSVFESHGTACVVTDFEDGAALADLLAKETRWEEASLAVIFQSIAAARRPSGPVAELEPAQSSEPEEIPFDEPVAGVEFPAPLPDLLGEEPGAPVEDDAHELDLAAESVAPPAKVKGAKKQALDGIGPPPANDVAEAVEPAAAPPRDMRALRAGASEPAKKPKPRAALIGLVAVAVAGLGAGAWYFTGQWSGGAPDPAMLEPVPELEDAVNVAPVDVEAAGGVASALQTLADDARKAGASAAAIAVLTAATERLGGMDGVREQELNPVAIEASAAFAATVLGDADARARRLARDIPWANPLRPAAAAKENGERQRIARDIRFSLAGVRGASSTAAAATDPATALTAARQALGRNATLNAAIARAYRSGKVRPPANIPLDTPAAPVAETVAVDTPVPIQPVAQPAAPTASGPVGRPSRLFPAKYRRFDSILDSARDTADDVIKLGRGKAPAADASAEAKEGYRVRAENARAARNYLTYLDGLARSMRGDRSEADVDLNIANAERTRGYLQQMLEFSRAAGK